MLEVRKLVIPEIPYLSSESATGAGVRQPARRHERLKSCEMGCSGEGLTKMPHDLTESGAFSRALVLNDSLLLPDRTRIQ